MTKGLDPLPFFQFLSPMSTMLDAENFVIGRVDYHLNFIWVTTAGRVDPLARQVYRYNKICKTDYSTFPIVLIAHAKLSSGNLKIVCISSGMGSCRSRMTFAPSSFGIDRAERRGRRACYAHGQGHTDALGTAQQDKETRSR